MGTDFENQNHGSSTSRNQTITLYHRSGPSGPIGCQGRASRPDRSGRRGFRRRCEEPAAGLADRRARFSVFHMSVHAILATVSDRPGILFGLTRVLADHRANITYVDI